MVGHSICFYIDSGCNATDIWRLHGYAISTTHGQAPETLAFIAYNVCGKTPLLAKTDVSSRTVGLGFCLSVY